MMISWPSDIIMALLASTHLTAAATDSSHCNTARFASLTLPNIEISNFNVTAFQNVKYTLEVDGVADLAKANPSVLSYCHVAITYTHPSQGDTVNTFIGLPLTSSAWNSRFAMTGGGGWIAGADEYIFKALAANYSTASTDGGHNLTAATTDWGMVSEGNVDWPNLQDFAYVALVEAASLGKQATELYYGAAPSFSYWDGCSTGGRQAHIIAQRRPELFDGILGGCPAINWDRFIMSELWPYLVMNWLGTHPPPCVFRAFTAAAVSACDKLDGVADGIISDPKSCDYNARELVGTVIDCTNPNGTVVVTDAMAALVNAIWAGPSSVDGRFEWYGLYKGAELTELATTTCTSVSNCTATPFSIAEDWLRAFVAKNSTLDLDTLTHADYDALFRTSISEFSSVIGTSDPDLTTLKKAGTKLLAWHGMADFDIPTEGTIDFYNRALAFDPGLHDYYRFFLAPGVGHCGLSLSETGELVPSNGFDPTSTIFQALVDWVEHDTAPETITGVGPAVGVGNDSNSTEIREVELCLYPKVLTYIGLDPNEASSFTCV